MSCICTMSQDPELTTSNAGLTDTECHCFHERVLEINCYDPGSEAQVLLRAEPDSTTIEMSSTLPTMMPLHPKTSFTNAPLLVASDGRKASLGMHSNASKRFEATLCLRNQWAHCTLAFPTRSSMNNPFVALRLTVSAYVTNLTTLCLRRVGRRLS